MALSTASLPSVTCAENISILRLLHPVPVLPYRNSVEFKTSCMPLDGYSLPFDRERKLVGVLAFLSSLTDDSDHIPAVCVQQDSANRCLRVLLAVNKKSSQDGKKALNLIKEGFEPIFAVLSQISDGEWLARIKNMSLIRQKANSPRDLEDKIFTAIVSMCSNRILCRMRLIPNARKKTKQPLKDVLKEAIHAVGQLKGEKANTTKAAAQLFVQSSKAVISLSHSWEMYQTESRLRGLVLGVYNLSQVRQLDNLLNVIPHRAMDPSSKKNLLNIIRKVSRYKEACRFLYRSARKFPVTRNMKVALAKLPAGAFHRASATEYKLYEPALESAIQRFQVPRSQPDLADICYILQISQGEANERFSHHTLKALHEGKVHAEVQLLAYCELNPSSHPPRVICSSKDACYFCNALLSMFKKMHTPRCHGKIYSGWRIPPLPSLLGVQRALNELLSQQISSSLVTLLRTRDKTVFPDPNESTLLTLPRSASTLNSPVAEQMVVPKGALSSRNSQTPEPQNVSSVSVCEQETTKDVLTSIMPSGIATGPARHDNLGLERNMPRLANTRHKYKYLMQGEIHSVDVECGASSRIFKAGPLEIQVEYSAAAGPMIGGMSGGGKTLCSLEWLTAEKADTLQQRREVRPIDIESLEAGVDIDIRHPDCFYMAAKGAIVRLQFKPR